MQGSAAAAGAHCKCTTADGIAYLRAGWGGIVCAARTGPGFDFRGCDMTGELVQHGYQLIAPSRFGYLRSPLPTDLTRAIQALRERQASRKILTLVAIILKARGGGPSRAVRQPHTGPAVP
jgi:hypothetical protein